MPYIMSIKSFEIVGWGIINGNDPNMSCDLCGRNISDASGEKNRCMISGPATDYEMVPCCGSCAKGATLDHVQAAFDRAFKGAKP